MNLLESFANLCGWITIWLFVATILNYVAKAFGTLTKQKKSKAIRACSMVLKKIFVRYHRLFGFLCFFFMLLHLLLQYLRIGMSVSGGIVGSLFLIQLLLGVYSKVKKKTRKGLWFFLHRGIAVLIILGIGVHLIFPAVLYKTNKLPSVENVSSTKSTENTSFTTSELAKYNGKNGQPAYVAYKGTVYDVSNVSAWKGGKHNGALAGTDITNLLSRAPHGTTVLSKLPVVGTFKN